MFKESPFTGACAYATYEVLVMLLGTLLLGLLLGYLIWGWLRRHVIVLKKQAAQSKRVSDLHQIQIVDLTTRLMTAKGQLERAETKVSLAEYKTRRALEELESLKELLTSAEKKSIHEDQSVEAESPTEREQVVQRDVFMTEDEPTLADISQVMETGTLSHLQWESETKKEDTHTGHVTPAKEISPDSLDLAGKVFGQPIAPDDLKIVYGIDQRIEDILRRSGVVTWMQLAGISLPDLRHLLEEAGQKYRTVDPKTWPIQARMAYREEWKKLKAYQDTLRKSGE